MSSKYLLLFRGNDWVSDLSPEEAEKALNRFMGWFRQLESEGKLLGANPLMDEARIVSGPNGQTVVDGPFAESKEAVGGYFLLDVADFDEAVEIARQCPTLGHGAQVEVRPVADVCPIMHKHGIAEMAAGA